MLLPDSTSAFPPTIIVCSTEPPLDTLMPLPTDSLTATQVLDFRDRAFLEYFRHPQYLAMLQRTFGSHVVAHVAEMCRHQVRRRHHDQASSQAA